MKVIAIWSGPRNVSTALMYSFANRGDLQVLDEPFFGHFLKYTGVWRPSREEALATMETDPDAIFKSILQSDQNMMMLKNMANHIEGIDLEKINDFHNVILTRNPGAVISSYTNHISTPTMLDLGYQHQIRIIEHLEDNGLPYTIVDSDDIRRNPASSLQNLCGKLEIPFSSRMLQWEAGPRPEDGVWAKYWYDSVHKSTGFAPPEDKVYEIPSQLENLLEECDSYYKILLEKS